MALLLKVEMQFGFKKCTGNKSEEEEKWEIFTLQQRGLRWNVFWIQVVRYSLAWASNQDGVLPWGKGCYVLESTWT